MPHKHKTKNKRNTKTKLNKSKPINRQKLINLMLSFLAVTLMVTIASYFFMPEQQNDKKQTTSSNIQKDFKEFTQKRQETFTDDIYKEANSDAFEEYTKEFEKDYANIEDIKKEIIDIIEGKKTDEDKITQQIDTIKKELDKTKKEATKIEPKKKKQIIKDTRPMLAIVIDDVTLQSQVNRINAIGYNITMSFMPPTPTHKNSAKIAQDLEFHMVHFPMQANSFKFEETDTLHIGDSYEKIEKRVAQIRKWYPNARYTNNHTGSKFTAHDQSMDYLMKALKKHNFIFMDSRTTSKTVGQKYAQKYAVPFLARNIFLDNKREYTYIQTQLKKAIAIAKKSGYAVVIGHPYKITLKVLTESKHLLKDLNMVYVNKIPKI